MSKENPVIEKDPNEIVVEKAKDFWAKYQRPILIGAILVIVVAGSFIGYKKFYKEPNIAKAEDAMFKAEEYYRMDSLDKALNGDFINAGLLKVIKNYGGTPAANLAHYYAGDIYVRKGEFAEAIKHLKEFSTDSKMIQAAAYKLMADAYSEQGQMDKGIEYYKKAAAHFSDDKDNAAFYLSLAAGLCEKAGKNDEAIKLYQELKDKYPQTAAGSQANKYLGKLGAFN